jgi:hypothetical protein
MSKPRLLALALLALTLGGCAAQRPEDPVVLTGADLPRLAGVQPAKVIAFRWLGQRWDQVPVQVDERAVIDLAKPKNLAPVGQTFLTYTDPNTFTGPDPNPTLDADDEVAFMGIDGGIEAPPGQTPPGIAAASGTKVRIFDATGDPTPSYLYLFQQTGNLDQAAGRPYVDYDFNLLSGDYKSTYKIGAGPNPENSTVTTGFYSHHFSDRWVDDALRITAPGAGGADILDRHKNLFAPGTCARSEDTFSAGPGAMIANKSGPVRAIRSYLGANSGTFTQRVHLFYERRQDITTYLRVHAIPGVMDFFDYSPAATGMTYRNDRNQAGVRVDGVPESPALGQIGWETMDGPQGSLAIAHSVSSDVPGLTSTSYYLDKQTPGGGAETQCTGDASAYGSSGPRITQALPNTDPTIGAANRLTTTRHLFYGAPGEAMGAKELAQARTPLQTTETPWP